MKKIRAKKTVNNLVTEDYLSKKLKSTENFLNFRINTLQEDLENFKKQFNDFKDKVLTNLDWLVGAFKKFDEEHTVMSHRNREISGKLENHETRIQSLEKRTLFQ